MAFSKQFQNSTLGFSIWDSGTIANTEHVLLSDDNIKKLYSFKNIDDAINYIWFNVDKQFARDVNKHWKA